MSESTASRREGSTGHFQRPGPAMSHGERGWTQVITVAGLSLDGMHQIRHRVTADVDRSGVLTMQGIKPAGDKSMVLLMRYVRME